jgi:hypothetical protein
MSSGNSFVHSHLHVLQSHCLSVLQGISKDEFGKIFGPATMHAIGHIAANISFAAVAISLTHTVKTLEPAFNVILSRCGTRLLGGRQRTEAGCAHSSSCRVDVSTLATAVYLPLCCAWDC